MITKVESAVQKWEYNQVHCYMADFDNVAWSCGESGWDLVSVVRTSRVGSRSRHTSSGRRSLARKFCAMGRLSKMGWIIQLQAADPNDNTKGERYYYRYGVAYNKDDAKVFDSKVKAEEKCATITAWEERCVIEFTPVPKVNYSRSGYTLQYANGKLAALDKGEGPYSAPGYTFETDDLCRVEVYPTKEAAEKAMSGFSLLKVVPITIEVKLG